MAMEPEEHFKTPEWVSRLENKHKKFHKLAHEIGSGSSCLKCGDACPGLDLHFWRKVCKNCKCKREEHSIADDDQYKQLDILFNDSQSKYQPVKAVLNMIIKPDGGQFVKKLETEQNRNAYKFDWVPPNVHKDLASEYMQLLPSDKLPISGSEGAIYRRQQLEKQVPLHDFNANVCHNLTAEEADAMTSYLQNLKENAVGQGLVKKLTDNTDMNLFPLFKNMNIIPKPFKKINNQQFEEVDEEEFPPPPPELLYPSNTELKTPSAFVGSKNYTGNNKIEVNMLDNANNNPAVCEVISQKPISNIARSEGLSQLNSNFSSNVQNDNYKPMMYNQNADPSLKNPILKGSKECIASNADTCILTDDKELFCKQCKKNVLPGQIAVMTERTGKEVFWHPSCFVCTTCEELLVDLVYFFNNWNVYCGRHYAEILNIPRCNACDELIFLKEYTIAEEHTYHVRHFCCFECDKPLAGLEYVAIEHQPVCLDCYESKYGKKCETCHNNIVATETRIGWKELSWHQSPACFKCYQCYTSLLGKSFTVKSDKPLCSKECVKSFLNSTEI